MIRNKGNKRDLKISAAEVLDAEVINDSMIKDYIITYNAENKIFDQDHIPITQITHLSLQFKSNSCNNTIDVKHVSNLDGLTHLQKLQLDNNIIEEIRGLNHLVNLQWLDLSFNRIKKIEGLEQLVNLTDLSLFQNYISVLEGMDTLTKLNYFSIGNNNIPSSDSIAYLQKFKNLQVLIIKGNPFYKNDTDSETRYLVIATLPQLKYLDYMMIDDESLKTAKLNNVTIHKSADEALQLKPEMTVESKVQELEVANIAGTHNFLEKLKDPDMKKLEIVPKQNELWAKFEEELKECLSSYQDTMKLMAKDRKEAMEICENMLKDEEKEAEDKGIKCIMAFNHKKKKIFKDIENKVRELQSQAKDSQIQKSINDNIEVLKKELKQLDADLMRIEMDHFDLAWTQAQIKFNATLETITNEMNKKTQTFKDDISVSNKKYHSVLRDIFQVNYDDIANRVNEVVSDNDPNREEILNAFGERETLLSVAESSNTTQSNKIDETCNYILTLLANVKSAFLKKLFDRIISRNRKVVKEIMQLLKDQEKEIDKFVQENTILEDDEN